MITSQPVTIEYQATDENKLESCRAVIDYEKPEGEKKIGGHRFGRKWSLKNGSASLVKTFQEDGIYKTSVQAVDKAKQKSEHFLQFMIDTKNPVIKMVDELQGKYLKKVFMGLSGGCIYQGLYDICPSDPDGRKVISDWDRD